MANFLAYHEPSIVQLLVLISFFYFLSLSTWTAARVIYASIIGPIAVGIIYGTPLANILLIEWQEAFVAVGYVGLLLIIFDGGLNTRLDLLKANIFTSLVGATTGSLTPIALSYLLLYLGFGYGAVETFIVGASLSATSLGTTLAVFSSTKDTHDLQQTVVGTVLVSAAIIDDVAALVMLSVISQLGQLSSEGANLGWIIGRPIMAAALIAILTPILSKYIIMPLFRRFIETRIARFRHYSNLFIMVFVLCAFISIAYYAGTSVLFGAYLAGIFLTALPSSSGPFCVASREEGETAEGKTPAFTHTFEAYIHHPLKYVLEPLFFASIGFAIPFLDLWNGKAIWRGVLYTLLMLLGKVLVGVWVLLWPTREVTNNGKKDSKARLVPAALLLGSAMVARGEIGLLIIQVGYSDTDYLSEAGFIIGIWASLLNTIIGPITVGWLIRRYGQQIVDCTWGYQPAQADTPFEKSDSTQSAQAEIGDSSVRV